MVNYTFRGTAATYIVYILNISKLSFKNKINVQTTTPFLNYLALELPIKLQYQDEGISIDI